MKKSRRAKTRGKRVKEAKRLKLENEKKEAKRMKIEKKKNKKAARMNNKNESKLKNAENVKQEANKKIKEETALKEKVLNEKALNGKTPSEEAQNKKASNEKASSVKKEKTKKGFNINYLFIFIFTCVLIYSISQIVMWYLDMKKAEEQHQELLTQVVIINKDENKENKEEQEKVSIDFDKLLEINDDVQGWVIVEGTNINYPVLQSYDNNYYLRRNINKDISKSGSIYLDYRNKGFDNDNTVLYGHNMKNGTMFAELKKIYNNELGNDVEIKVYTPEKEKTYKVFSTYAIAPEGFNVNIGVEEALDYTKIDFKVEPKEDDKILTLFTCTDTMAQRIIVHAVLVEEIEEEALENDSEEEVKENVKNSN